MSHPPPPFARYPGAIAAAEPLGSARRLARAAMTLSTIAVVTCWLPFLDIPVWSLGFALALLAVARLARGDNGRGIAGWAVAMSIVAAAVNITTTTLVILAIAHHADPCSAKYLGGGSRSVCEQTR